MTAWENGYRCRSVIAAVRCQSATELSPGDCIIPMRTRRGRGDANGNADASDGCAVYPPAQSPARNGAEQLAKIADQFTPRRTIQSQTVSAPAACSPQRGLSC